MKKTFMCTRENPLHKQMNKEESLLIEELEVKGYLDGDDYELLTEMSGEKGCLKRLDLFGVTESFPGPKNGFLRDIQTSGEHWGYRSSRSLLLC